MAKKRVIKSKVIREIIAAQPTATIDEIRKALAARKVKASDALINKLKYTKGGRKKRKASANGHVNIDQLLIAKRMVAQLGGMENARETLDQLAKLTG